MRAGFVSDTKDLQGKEVTVQSAGLLNVEEAFRLFVEALESVGVTVQPDEKGTFTRIVRKA